MDPPDQAAPAYDAQPPPFQAQPAPAPNMIVLTDNQFMQLIAVARETQQAPVPPAPAPAPVRMRPREPDPFDGTQAKYRTWKSQMVRYLASAPESSENQRISVLLSNIRGPNVDGWVTAYSDRYFDTTHSEWMVTLERVWADLDQTYTDRMAERTALRQLESLRQVNCKDGRAADYFQKFEGYLQEAGLRTDDRLVVEWLKRGISDKIRESIHRGVDLPETYDQWKQRVLQLDENWLQCQAIKPERSEPAPRQPSASTSARQLPPQPARQPQIQTPTGILYGGRGQPMDLDQARGRVSVCFQCGKRRYEGGTCQNPWHRVPGAAPPAANQQRVPVAGQAQVRAWEADEFRETVRKWAAEDPESFRAEGFGNGPA